MTHDADFEERRTVETSPPAGVDYERLYEDVLPSLVSLYDAPDGRRGSGGSGFVYDTEGNVVTNEHVVDGPELDVRFAEGDWRTGRVTGTDPYTDLAVVRVTDLPAYATPLPVADENPRPGLPVAALGNPLGLDGSITAGIVSGAGRSMSTDRGFSIPDVVQTDAAINPGNSGGPLVSADERHEVVGVNRAKGGDNIGFAISPVLLSRVVPALIEDGECRHSYLQVRTVDVTPAIAEANGIDDGGVLVVDAHPDHELRPCRGTTRARGREIPVGGDVIASLDGRELRSNEELTRYLMAETRPGETVTVGVLRDGREEPVTITLDERPASEARGRRVPVR